MCVFGGVGVGGMGGGTFVDEWTGLGLGWGGRGVKREGRSIRFSTFKYKTAFL